MASTIRVYWKLSAFYLCMDDLTFGVCAWNCYEKEEELEDLGVLEIAIVKGFAVDVDWYFPPAVLHRGRTFY